MKNNFTANFLNRIVLLLLVVCSLASCIDPDPDPDPDPTPCPEPTGVTITATTATTATISWSSPTGPTGWRIIYGPSSGGGSTTVTASSSPYTVTGLTPGVEYGFFVRSVCGAGSLSDRVGPVTTTTNCIYPEILTTAPDTICGPGDGLISATATPGAVIEWFNDAAMTTLLHTGSSFSPTVSENTTFYARPRPAEGNCPGMAVAVPVIVHPLPEVELGSDTAICLSELATLETLWKDSYNYAWNTGATTNSILAGPGDYNVTVTNEYGCIKSDSVVVSVRPSAEVEGFNFVPFFEDGTRKVQFTALYPTDAENYFWDFGDGSTSTDVNPIHVFATDAVYTVTLVVSNSCGSDSSSLTISVDMPTGVSSLNVANIDLDLYPNPSRDVITIKSGKAIGLQQVFVYNVLGSIVYKGNAFGRYVFELPVGNLPSGMYTVKIGTDKGIVARKIEVLH